ncbi:hypothetical protein [Aquimarina celericrescens]|uniref:Uncharacterized protein n=1 Tax=Aquimarina celericrescens TaxID=1964542 RepID=A0ABW5ATR2_9FLAO|nr:hypothetical protein [Aquimarina celericrescens]
MKNILKFVVIMAVMGLFYACQNESDFEEELVNGIEEIEVEGAKSGIYVSKDGVLNFDTMEDFQKTILWIKNVTDDEALEWNEELGFESLHSLYMTALSEEEKMMEDFSELISSMMNVETDQEISDFKEKFANNIPLFQKSRSDIEEKYQNYIHFENSRVIGMKTYDPIISRLTTKEGYVYVGGSKLQYTEESLTVIPNFQEQALAKKSNKEEEKEEIHVFNFAAKSEVSTKSSQTQEYADRCSTQFDSKKKLTGNTKVINTVVPIYDRVWVPRVCETICPGLEEEGNGEFDGPTPIDIEDCYESCTGGYYRNILRGYNYINTRLEATHRNYKIVCFIGCWENWDKRHAEITVSGVHNEVISPGNVEKYSWIKDISPRSSGTLIATYRSDLSFLLSGTCFTQTSW